MTRARRDAPDPRNVSDGLLDPPTIASRLAARLLAAAGRNPPRRPPRTRAPDLDGRTIAGRFRVTRRIARGAFGAVYLARDRLRGEDVAVKLLLGAPTRDAGWNRRELAALLLLDDPGVVRILGNGTFEGTPYVVTDLVRGRAFPGRRGAVAWRDLEPVAVQLLETLARVHALGIVHGDIKPANVLVESDGRVQIVDFGIAAGPTFDAGGLRDASAGTPAYLAPEQIADRTTPATQHTDLYAVGVLLHEALTGVLPQARGAALRRRGVPPHVVRAVMSLLAPAPHDRPSSAAEASLALRGTRAREGLARTLAARAADRLAPRVLAKLRTRRVVRVCGPRGAALAVVLDRVAATLRLAATPVVHVRRGRRAPDFSKRAARRSVVLLVEQGVDLRTPALRRAMALAHRVVLACRAARGSGVRAEPLGADDLRDVFGGSDVVFHEREDAVREIVARTGGWPDLVVDETSAWVRAGLATRDGDRIVVERQGLDALRGGTIVAPRGRARTPVARTRLGGRVLRALLAAEPRATAATVARALGVARARARRVLLRLAAEGAAVPIGGRAFVAAALPGGVRFAPRPGSGARLAAIAALGRWDLLAAEVERRSRRHLDDGRAGAAFALARHALAALPHGPPGAAARTVIARVLCESAIDGGTERALEIARFELMRSAGDLADSFAYDMLLHAALEARRGAANSALAKLDACGEAPTVRLEAARRSASIVAARWLPERRTDVERAAQAWARRRPERFVRHRALDWLAWGRYAAGDFRGAAAAHARAARVADVPGLLVRSLLGGSGAAAADLRPEAALVLAQDAARIAARARNVHLEARALHEARDAAYRLGVATRADTALVEAVERVGVPSLAAHTALTEAAVAWRAGDRTLATELGQRAALTWRRQAMSPGALLAAALVAAAGGPCRRGLERDARRAARNVPPGVTLQILGLLALSERGCGAGARRLATRCARALPPATSHVRREILSLDECREALRAR